MEVSLTARSAIPSSRRRGKQPVQPREERFVSFQHETTVFQRFAHVELPREYFRPDACPATHPQIGMFGGGFLQHTVPAINREPEVKLLIRKIELQDGPQPGGGARIETSHHFTNEDAHVAAHA